MPVYRGKVAAFDSATHTATVRLDGSAPQVLEDVATTRAIASTEMTPGRRVLIDTGETSRPTDFVVTAVWD